MEKTFNYVLIYSFVEDSSDSSREYLSYFYLENRYKSSLSYILRSLFNWRCSKKFSYLIHVLIKINNSMEEMSMVKFLCRKNIKNHDHLIKLIKEKNFKIIWVNEEGGQE